MIKRRLEDKIRSALLKNPAVALMGPRQVGKTTLAIEIAKGLPSVYLDLENRQDLQKTQDIEAFYRANNDKLIILDEIQRVPEIFATIRGLIDEARRQGRRAGQFLFLGSASMDLLKQSSETLAGRLAYIELYPIDFTEIINYSDGPDSLNKLWLRGGFPDSLLTVDDKDSLTWRNNFIKTYLERDIPQLGPRIPAQTLERFWIMLAHYQGTNINASKIAANIEVSSVTVSRYIDLLSDLLLIRKILPYTQNIKKRLVKTPRIYIRDSGITHALLNIGSFNDLLGHPVIGKSWEGFVIENIASVLPEHSQLSYYRTTGGAEIDLILEFGLNKKWAVEIKRSPQLSLNKGFHEACNDIAPQKKFVVYSGPDTFSLPHDVIAIPLLDFMKLLMADSEIS